MPSNFTLRAVNTAHRALLRLSFGRLGTEYFGMPALELVTIGRKSGRPRSVMLFSISPKNDVFMTPEYPESLRAILPEMLRMGRMFKMVTRALDKIA